MYAQHITLFYYLEEVGMLDPESTADRFVLHTIFTPRINLSLSEFGCAWNNHPLRTERNWSPKKIWLNGVVDPANADLTEIRDIIEGIPPEGLDNFGLDPEAPLPLDLDMDSYTTVDVDDVQNPLNDEDFQTFIAQYDPLTVCEDYGISLYSDARTFVRLHQIS